MPILFLYILGLIILGSIAWGALSIAPWLPTKKKDLTRILDLAELKPGDIFYELGCGDGGVASYVAKNSEAKVIGLEIALPLYFMAKLRQIFLGRDNLKIKLKSIFSENLSQAKVIYVFGTPDSLIKKLKDKFKRELKPGTKIMSYSFFIKGWEPIKVSKPKDKDLAIYIYDIK